MNAVLNPVLERIRNGIIVSVQASHGEPLSRPEFLLAMAESALAGGACGVRMADRENIGLFRKHHHSVPLIGITKPAKIPANAHELVYITPTFADVEEIAVDCDIVALDATRRPRPDGQPLEALVEKIRAEYPALLLMADIATLEEALNAEQLGFDLISTTLSGYTTESLDRKAAGPDFELLAAIAEQTHVPVIMEGRLWEPAEVSRAFAAGAFAAVIGSAVTRPHEITRRFVAALPAAV